MVESQRTSVAGLSIVICDDKTLLRDCLAIALRSKGIETRSAWDLRSLLHELDGHSPDVILLNIGTRESETLLQVAMDVGPDSRVIVIGLSEDKESDIVSCAEAGVAGLHLRDESFEQLVTLIDQGTRDEAACSAEVSAILLRRIYALLGPRNPEVSDLSLTERETQIVQLLEEGLSNQQIASRLTVSIHTVKNQAHSLFVKLGVGSRAEAVAAYRATRRSFASLT